MASEYRLPALEPALEPRREMLIASLRHAVRDERVLDAMARVRRDLFVPPRLREESYDDRALAIGSGQTISQPQIVALMTAALMVGPDDTVLDVGTGSGYQAAILSLLARRVVSVERITDLADSARARLGRLGYENVDVHRAGNELGRSEGAPYDGIIVAAAAPAAPDSLINQLARNGRLVVPVGSRYHQVLIRVTRSGEKTFSTEDLGPCQFVPLIGIEGWPK